MASKRAGKTIKVSISLDRRQLETLKRLARTSYAGNLSAAFAEAAEILRQRAAQRRIDDLFGGAVLTPQRAAELDAEYARPAKRRRSAA